MNLNTLHTEVLIYCVPRLNARRAHDGRHTVTVAVKLGAHIRLFWLRLLRPAKSDTLFLGLSPTLCRPLFYQVAFKLGEAGKDVHY